MTRNYFSVIKTHYKLISSLIWISILIIFWENIYQSSTVILNDISENIFVLKFLFFLQALSFALPVIALKGFKRVFGHNNIIYRTYSEEKIANSKFLRALDSILDGENLLFLIGIISTIIYYFLPDYGNSFFLQLQYIFTHSFYMIFLLNPRILTGLIVLGYLFIPDLMFVTLCWTAIIVLSIFAINFPLIFGIILVLNFIWP